MQYIRYCNVDKCEISSYNMSGTMCKCHKQAVRVFCVDCDTYVTYSMWNRHVIEYPGHNRRTFSNLEPIKIFDMNSEQDEPVLIIQQPTNKTIYKTFIDTLEERGYTREDALKKWYGISNEEKDSFFRNPTEWSIPSDEQMITPPTKRKNNPSGYKEYIRFMMAPGVKLVDIGAAWQKLSREEKEEFHVKAEKREMEGTPVKKTAYKRGRSGYQEFCTTCKGMDTHEISEAWRALSHSKKQKFAEKAKATHPEEDEEAEIDLPDNSDEETATMLEKRETRKRHTGFSEYLEANHGKDESSVYRAWGRLSEAAKRMYFDIARQKVREELKRARKARREQESDSDSEESDEEDDDTEPNTQDFTNQSLSTLEESAIKLSSLVQASKNAFITSNQFAILQKVITCQNHYLRSTAIFLASLLEEHMKCQDGIERWRELGMPVVDNVIQLYKE